MKRHFVTIMCSLSNFVIYSMRLNLNIAITEMVDRQTGQQSNGSNITENQNHNTIPTFDWDEKQQQIILGAFYYGYAISPLPAGWLVGKIGGKKMIGASVLCASFLTALIPWVAGVSVGLMITLKILDGLAQGTVYPACYVILGKWTVPNERGTALSIWYSGTIMAIIVSNYVSGWICSAYELGGWPVSFYTYSICGVVWTIVWILLIYETPQDDLCISTKETEYLTELVIEDEKITSIPWWDILTSPAVWAVCIGCVAYDTVFYFILTEAPIFIYTILGFDVKTTGRLASIPSIVKFPIMILSGIASDYIIRREWLSVLNTRKLFIILDLGVSAACLLAIGYFGPSASIVLLVMAFGAIGLSGGCLIQNPAELSKKYSGIITGISQPLTACSGFIGPIILSILIEGNNTFQQWSLMFALIAVAELFAMVFFLIFGKAEEEEWSKDNTICINDETAKLID